MHLPWLEHPSEFPDCRLALRQPNGLLAAGGQLTPQWLIAAYRRGVFPWYGENEPLLWWSPDPRWVLLPEQLHLSKSLQKFIKRTAYRLSCNQAFAQVIKGCAQPRADGLGTWLNDDMQAAYLALHEQGLAHSIECWQQDQLVGGLYGVKLGQVFFGESMFSQASNASKLALVHLVKHQALGPLELIDCQVHTPYLQSMGAKAISRADFQKRLSQWTGLDAPHRVDHEITAN